MSIVSVRETAAWASAYPRVGDGHRSVVATCATCGAELDDVSQRFCGGDRCRRVFMNRGMAAAPDERAISRSTPATGRSGTTWLAAGGHGATGLAAPAA
jgi:hypothetical protein